jgi:ABC-type sulfate transport system substrate-binding protein
MNPAWLGPIFVVVCSAFNGAWALFNYGQKVAIDKSRAESIAEISALKEWMAKEYISRDVCAIRHHQAEA